MKNLKEVLENKGLKIQHFKDTVDHIRLVQDNIMIVCQAIWMQKGDYMDLFDSIKKLAPFFKVWFDLDNNGGFLIEDLLRRLVFHDHSKFDQNEWPYFAVANHGNWLQGVEYGTEEYFGRIKEFLGPALSHHYVNNDHHPEFFKESSMNIMPLSSVIEMLCDWEAATSRHKNGDVMTSVDKNSVRFGYNDEIAGIFKEFFFNLNYIKQKNDTEEV